MSRGLYVHFPFCLSKCSYCDFYKELHDRTLEEQFYQALKIETDLVAESLGEKDKELSRDFLTLYSNGLSLKALEMVKELKVKSKINK